MIIVSLMACQKSPEQELVQGKNDGQLESAIYQGQESRSDSEIIDSGKEITWEEFSYQDEFSGAEDTVTVKVDASGVWQTNHLPVLRVRPRNLTVEDVRRERLQEGTEEDIYAYSLVYIPVYEGVEVTKQIQMSSYPDDSYGAMYDYEKVGVTVRENGITEFKWTAPLEVTSVENGDVQVLPFSEICQRFQSQMQIEYTLGRLSRENPQNSDYQEVLAGIKAGEIHVTDIQFGLVRIQIPNNYDEFRLVPAWSFRGIESLDTGGGHYWYEDLDQDALSRTEHVYQTINAVDGTYINVRLGY
ncbi:DUF6034 family protein [Cuneatibacter sp. NSJ-177]|uniref:DUF6034 family protein n=1 Tax=Cuneatibacter sp. NSJ-177 TaxID=2931401 RepID=UPI001FD46954|nr:DUF6034 family protein [Cuneatibacter sp. NSJ-177]MCJ7836679.1 DUF6034 family protein [Cuneatibacter sp. NSJ-177]